MASPKKRSQVEEILLRAGIIDELQLRAARARQATWGGRLARSVAELGFATEETCAQAIARALGLPLGHLGTVLRDQAALGKLDVKYCEAHTVFPVGLRDRTLVLAMADPNELDILDEVQAMAGVRVQPLFVAETEILAAISRHYRHREYRPPSRGARRFTDEEVPAAGASSHGQRTEATFELDGSAPPRPQGFLASELAEQPSANTLLDEILDGRRRDDLGFTRDELRRLEAARQNQEKTTTILRTLRELLAEKGFEFDD